MELLFSQQRGRYSLLFWVLCFTVWTAVALLNTVVLFYRFTGDGIPVTWLTLLLVQLIAWYIWGGFTPLILWLGRKVPIASGGFVAGIGFHLFASGFLSVVFVACYVFIFHTVYGIPITWEAFQERFVNFFLQLFNWDVLIYWAILGAGYAFEYYRKFRDRELQAVQLEAQLVDAQLQALKMQLNPHFLFNTLHTIAAKVRLDEKESSVEMLSELSDLLRQVLEQDGRQLVALQEELGLLEAYLRIESIRFRDKLKVEFNIEAGTRQAAVPNMILQPLVENAVKHGLSKNIDAGRLRISAKREGEKLVLAVYNDGPKLSETEPKSGIGLSNTKERLQQIYGEAARFELRNKDRGVVASISIPFKLESIQQTP